MRGGAGDTNRGWRANLAAAMLVVALGTVLLAGAPSVRAKLRWRARQGMAMMGMHGGGWLGRFLGIAALVPAGTAGAAPALPPAAMPVPPTQIGINLAAPVWYNLERSFANLAIGSTWQYQGPKGWTDAAPPAITNQGAIVALPGSPLHRLLAPPPTPPGGSTIRCTFAGKAVVVGNGAAANWDNRSSEVRYLIKNDWQLRNTWLQVQEVKGPGLSDLDCRETTMPRDRLFDPGFVAGLAGFRVLRFKDWQQTDNNQPERWADRHLPAGIDYLDHDGVPVEDMLALAREVGADPWLCMPWNADADYYRHYAQLVHDRLPPNRKVYVEVANEVWNWSYPVTHQASREGIANGLTKDGNEAILLRLGQKTVEVMKPWEEVFADRPGQLVRVVAAQHVNEWGAGILLRAPGLIAHIDALATAPYFGVGMQPAADDASLDRFFHDLDQAATKTIDQAVAMKAIAYRLHKRYIGYEAGQHVIIPDLGLAQRVQRDPRMAEVYTRYLHGWAGRVGDVLALFQSSSIIGGSGGWGLVEHRDQPLAEAPKLRAVRAFLAEGR